MSASNSAVAVVGYDGTPLPARVGPLQLIATGENRPGRWVRQLVALEVKSLP